MKPIPYGRHEVTSADIDAVVSALRSDYLTQGPRIETFEKKFAQYVGAKYAVAVSSGTAALHMGALALGLKPGQRVVTTPLTFAASANCVLYAGGEVHFSDIDPQTYLLDLQKLRALLEKFPRGHFAGVIPVDFAGLPIDLEALRKLADEFGLWILEDASHAPGASFTGRSGKTYRTGDGQLADLTVFSFHPVKHIACGEGGMLTTNRADLYEKLLMLRSHGITKNPASFKENHGPWYYEMQMLGYNYRITDIQCALGTSQLDRASARLEARHQVARRYSTELSRHSVRLPVEPKGFQSAWHLYPVQVAHRKRVFESLRDAGVWSQVHYLPVYRLPYYQSLGFAAGLCPEAEAYYERALSLPMFPELTSEEQTHVIRSLIQALEEGGR